MKDTEQTGSDQPLSDVDPPRRSASELRLLFLCAVSEDRIPKDKLDDVVDRYVQVSANPSTDDGRFWKLYAELVRFVKPATVFGLQEAENLGQKLGWLPFRRRASSPTRQSMTNARTWMSFALMAVIVVQIFSLVGARVLDDLRSGNAAWEQVMQQESQVRSSNKEMSEEQEPLRSIISRKETIGNRLSTNYELLATWNRRWGSDFIMDLASVDGARKAIVTEQLAHTAMQAIGLYLLPMLYGLLGATVFVLRRLNSELQQRNFSPTAPSRYRMRYPLGLALGATAGLIFLPSTGEPQNPALLAITAFLAGFSVEPVFSRLDSIVANLRKSDRQEKDGAGQNPASPRRAAAGNEVHQG